MADTTGKRQAQLRADRIHAFRRELEQLEHEGVLLLSPEQRLQLDAHLDKKLAELAGQFDVDISESQKKISLAMRIASALGGLAFCAAVFLFFYRYWGLLGTASQVVILVTVPILGLLAVDWISRREKTLYYTSLIVLVVLAAFILNLFVLGSIFGIVPSPGAFLAWGILALILAYAYRLQLPLAGGLIAVVIYAAAAIVSMSGAYWGAVVERPETFFPGGVALLAAPLVLRHSRYPDFSATYRTFGLLFLMLALIILNVAGQLSFLPFGRKTVEGIYQVVGFAGAVAVVWTGLRHKLPEAVNLGSIFFAVLLFIRLFVWWWDWMPKYLFFLIIGAIALVLLAVFRKLRTGSGKTETA